MEQSLDYRSLPLSDNILRAVEAMGFTEMTEIQQKAIQPGLEGRDIIAKAPTGTGKTCAFGIPILERIDLSLRQPQALILSPTRELATQIRDELRELGQFFEGLMIAVVYGGQSMQRQIDALKKGPRLLWPPPAGCRITSITVPSGWTGSPRSSWTKPTACSIWAFIGMSKRFSTASKAASS